MDNKDSLFAFLFGAAVGVAIGILYAPKSGKETRAQLKQFSQDLADDIKEKGSKIVEEGKVKFDQAVEKGKAAYSKHSKKFSGSSEELSDDIVE